MSQFYIQGNGSGPTPIPGSVPEQFNTDKNSPSVPVAHIENVFGGTSFDDNPNGIQTDGSSGGNTLTIQLTNRLQGTATTSDGAGQTQTILTYAMNVASTVTFEVSLAAIEASGPNGVGGFVSGTVFRGGGAPLVIGIVDVQSNTTAALNGATFNLTVSGNNAIITVTGKAGFLIEWVAVATFVQKVFI